MLYQLSYARVSRASQRDETLPPRTAESTFSTPVVVFRPSSFPPRTGHSRRFPACPGRPRVDGTSSSRLIRTRELGADVAAVALYRLGRPTLEDESGLAGRRPVERKARRLLRAAVVVVQYRIVQSLRITLLPDRHTELVEIEDSESLASALGDFLNRTGRFTGDWVQIEAGKRDRYVRFDQIIQVETQMDPESDLN